MAYGFSALQSGDRRSLRTALPQLLPMLRGFNLITQLSASKSVVGLNLLGLWDDRGTLQPWIAPISQAIEEGIVKPVVHAAIPFDKAPEAHRILSERQNVGKVILVP